MSVIDTLQEWYKSISKSNLCTGIQIETVNNSGWSVCIDLFDTIYENESFETIHIQNSDGNWFKCEKENCIFKGYGGIQNLEDILKVFFRWLKPEVTINEAVI